MHGQNHFKFIMYYSVCSQRRYTNSSGNLYRLDVNHRQSFPAPLPFYKLSVDIYYCKYVRDIIIYMMHDKILKRIQEAIFVPFCKISDLLFAR